MASDRTAAAEGIHPSISSDTSRLASVTLRQRTDRRTIFRSMGTDSNQHVQCGLLRRSERLGGKHDRPIQPGFRNSDEKFRIAKKIERRLSPCGPSHFDAFTGFYCGAVRISGDNPLNHKHYFSSHISQYFDCGIRAHVAYCTEAVRRVYSYGVDIIEKLGSDSLKRRLIVTLV